ncbi:unnamed protein product [Withania somnifera]
MDYFSWILFLLAILVSSNLGSSSDDQGPMGPVINVTKRISFQDFSSNNPRLKQDLTPLGSAIVSDEEGNLKHLAGRAIYSFPIRFFDPRTQTPASFETTFSFQFEVKSNSSNERSNLGKSVGGGGLTFIIVPDELTVGRAGPWLGMPNDLCDDDYKIFGDPNDNHLGINLGSVGAAINASDVGVQLNDGYIHRVWISYDGRRRFIDILLAPDNKGYPSKSVYSSSFASDSFNVDVPSKIMFQNSTRYETTHRKTPSSFFIFLVVVILLVVVLINLYFGSYKRDDNTGEAITRPRKTRPKPPNKACRFTIVEVSIATRNFGELQILGDDEKSVTYKATISSGCNVVEIKAINKIRHPNLVPIREWCYDNQETVVVYDFIPNGSLDKWLFGVGVLPWTRRFKVVKDLADSLVYLHSKQLTHKNIKSSMVGDFEFVLTSTGSTRFESMVSRTREIQPGERDLLDLAWAMHKVPRRKHCAIRALDIGLLCTPNENKGRPIMEEVVEFLNMEKAIAELPPGRPVCLFPYSSTTGL